MAFASCSQIGKWGHMASWILITFQLLLTCTKGHFRCTKCHSALFGNPTSKWAPHRTTYKHRYKHVTAPVNAESACPVAFRALSSNKTFSNHSAVSALHPSFRIAPSPDYMASRWRRARCDILPLYSNLHPVDCSTSTRIISEMDSHHVPGIDPP